MKIISLAPECCDAQQAQAQKNDLVVVIAGKDRGRQGKILRVLPTEGRVIVERVNMIKRHTRPNPAKNIAAAFRSGRRRFTSPT